jgi:hypothetical protein
MCANATSNDLLSQSPDLVFLNIAEYLSLNDLYNLSALNKSLRYRTLTTMSFQNIVRNRLARTWALPVEGEYTDAHTAGYPYANATGDWLLYGYHVFNTPSMRNRRRIFNIVAQLKAQYLRKASEAGYLDGPESEAMHAYFAMSIDEQLLIHRLNELYDFDLFIQVMDLLNPPYFWHVRSISPKYLDMPEQPRHAAYEIAKSMMVGKTARTPRFTYPMDDRGKVVKRLRIPPGIEEQVLLKINQRLKLIVLEKNKYLNSRRGAPARV